MFFVFTLVKAAGQTSDHFCAAHGDARTLSRTLSRATDIPCAVLSLPQKKRKKKKKTKSKNTTAGPTTQGAPATSKGAKGTDFEFDFGNDPFGADDAKAAGGGQSNNASASVATSGQDDAGFDMGGQSALFFVFILTDPFFLSTFSQFCIILVHPSFPLVPRADTPKNLPSVI